MQNALMKGGVMTLKGRHIAGFACSAMRILYRFQFSRAGARRRESCGGRLEQLAHLHNVGGARPLHSSERAGQRAFVGDKERAAADLPGDDSCLFEMRMSMVRLSSGMPVA